MGFEIRPDLAAALSTVSGVQGFERAEAATGKVGDAFPKWSVDTRIAPGVFETSWAIVVHLPTDAEAREAWIETHRWPIVDAVAHLIHVDSIAPDVLNDNQPVLMIIGRE